MSNILVTGANGQLGSELKDFKINFSEQKGRFVKVVATSLKQTPTGGSVWLFIDAILID